MTFGNLTVMVIGCPETFLPVVIFTGLDSNPGDNCTFIDLCSLTHLLDIVHDMIPYLRFNPSPIYIDPFRLFFKDMFSSTNSEIN